MRLAEAVAGRLRSWSRSSSTGLAVCDAGGVVSGRAIYAGLELHFPLGKSDC
ncbi:hypothetical protein BN6_29040 [Saccharothrix espanaensis DSM 44229]|uniref:Uncharacterized protein n=1 Tax=Saccharothrix espanaensis (strain ATCC 51144 / DSM 44229 / JCM 9112 / NBRC 15066 / NRRL 15764) TaxID=1179773 RepID=K0K0W7_SACES|nr:hypothetical protein BN6_29040 [Saccharothrix espanaensis DSM 44229]